MEETKQTTEALKFKPKSGRVWKSVQKERTSAMAKGSGSKLGWDGRQEILKKQKIAKQLEKELVDERIAKKRQLKEERLERQKRKEENEKQAEIVQKISAAKLRRMKKKQLRNLKKQ